MNQSIGRIQEVNFRDVWQWETDFSKWLAEEENIPLLGQMLGVELTEARTEEAIGPYRTDVICNIKDIEGDAVIENQIGPSDHKHLGQFITYLSSEDHDVKVAVWIAESFTKAHIDAVNAQNKCANDIDHYAVTVKLLKIDDSAPAPCFEVAAKPEIRKLSIEDTPEKKKRRTSYKTLWQDLDSYLKNNGGYAQLAGQPTGRTWVGIKAKTEDLQLRTGYSFPKKEASLTFWFTGKDKDRFYQQLKSAPAVLEKLTEQDFDLSDNGTEGEDFWGGGYTVRIIDFGQEGNEAISAWYLKMVEGIQQAHEQLETESTQ